MPSLPDEFFAAPSGTRLDSSRLGNHARWLVIAVGSAPESFWIVRLETIALAYMLWRDRFTTCGGHSNRRDTVCSCDEPRAGVMSVSPFRFQAGCPTHRD